MPNTANIVVSIGIGFLSMLITIIASAIVIVRENRRDNRATKEDTIRLTTAEFKKGLAEHVSGCPLRVAPESSQKIVVKD